MPKPGLLAGVALLAALALTGAPRAEGTHGGITLSDTDRLQPMTDGGYEPPDPATLGGSFDLIDPEGRPVTDRDLRGRWLLVYFGFAACRESCPVALSQIAVALDALGPEGGSVQPVFVDVSLEKPDPVGVGNFVASFHPRILGLTGSRRQTFDIVRKFQVRREHVHVNRSTKETGPRFDHSSYIYLVDPDGHTRAYVSHSVSPDEIAALVRQYAGS